MSKFRVGMVGIGGISTAHRVRAYAGDPRVEIVAMCDLVPEKCENAKERYNQPQAKVYTDFREMIDREELDAVDIATPNYLHSVIAVYALERGLNVFCEKPDAVSVAEAEKMKRAAEASGKTLMVMRNRRFMDQNLYMKKLK